MSATIRVGDCRAILADYPDEHFDAIVFDPPYELGFMGKSWDRSGVAFQRDTWEAVRRVMKPGAHLVAFGGTRTHHRLMVAIEDAGFELRDVLTWLYGSGMPKSHNISKAIDKAAGASGTFGDPKSEKHAGWIKAGTFRADGGHEGYQRPWMDDSDAVERSARMYEPATEDARKWDGWGTGLAPSWEPIVLARKPFKGSVTNNVLAHGTGALNIDACLLEAEPGRDKTVGGNVHLTGGNYNDTAGKDHAAGPHTTTDRGRWPPNLAIDPEAAAMIDAQTGTLKSGLMKAGTVRGKQNVYSYPGDNPMQRDTYGDSGGASRFFYCAKASRTEREIGMAGADMAPLNWSSGDANPGSFQSAGTNRNVGNNHPTVKPLDLMQWLIRLVTPPGGLICDPFAGSGSTGIAALREGFQIVLIELLRHHADIARRRIVGDAPLINRVELIEPPEQGEE